MKASRILKGSLLAMALVLATTAFAADKGSLQLYDTISVGGQHLKAGDYTVKWQGNGNAVEVNILKGKHVVATVPAQIVTLPVAPEHDAAVVNRNDDGSRSLSEVRFSGKKYALQISGDSSGSAAGSSSK
jgi:hypothetical protein